MNKLTASPKRYLRYERLANHFREQVASGALKPGDQLPSFAQMQAEHGVGQAILERVYTILESENLIIRRPKQGIFVAEPRKRDTLNVVGVFLGTPHSRHPYYSLLLDGIHEVAHREGVEILLLHENSSVGLEKMDGVILTDPLPRIPQIIPRVSIVRPFPGTPCIQVDEYGGTKLATQHLLSLGHTQIAYLHPINDFYSDPLEPSIAKLRIGGYKDALKEAGLKARRRWMRPIREPWEAWEWETNNFTIVGYNAMKRWLDEDWEQGGCTAILGHNDDFAIGMMRAFRERGIRVPEDVSVVGFDGTPVCEQVTPMLTTVSVPLRELGMRGLEFLLRRIDQTRNNCDPNAEKSMEEVLSTTLEVRESTAPPAQ